MGKLKNTRLIYNDKQNLETYESLPPEQFKELFMKMLTYKLGETVSQSDFSNPLIYALFKVYQSKIDYNETKWNETSRKRQDAANKRWNKNNNEETESEVI